MVLGLQDARLEESRPRRRPSRAGRVPPGGGRGRRTARATRGSPARPRRRRGRPPRPGPPGRGRAPRGPRSPRSRRAVPGCCLDSRDHRREASACIRGRPSATGTTSIRRARPRPRRTSPPPGRARTRGRRRRRRPRSWPCRARPWSARGRSSIVRSRSMSVTSRSLIASADPSAYTSKVQMCGSSGWIRRPRWVSSAARDRAQARYSPIRGSSSCSPRSPPRANGVSRMSVPPIRVRHRRSSAAVSASVATAAPDMAPRPL